MGLHSVGSVLTLVQLLQMQFPAPSSMLTPPQQNELTGGCLMPASEMVPHVIVPTPQGLVYVPVSALGCFPVPARPGTF